MNNIYEISYPFPTNSIGYNMSDRTRKFFCIQCFGLSCAAETNSPDKPTQCLYSDSPAGGGSEWKSVEEWDHHNEDPCPKCGMAYNDLDFDTVEEDDESYHQIVDCPKCKIRLFYEE